VIRENNIVVEQGRTRGVGKGGRHASGFALSLFRRAHADRDGRVGTADRAMVRQTKTGAAFVCPPYGLNRRHHGTNYFAISMGCPARARAERLAANPSNLIRIMPAEGA